MKIWILMKSWITGILKGAPLHVFTFVSLALIFVMFVVTGYTQSRFFEDELIRHESGIVREMVLFLAREELRAEDFDNYTSATSQQNFEQSFSILRNVPGVVRIKLLNADNTVIWSDVKAMVGENNPGARDRIERMWAWVSSSIYDPGEPPSHLKYPLPHRNLMEFFVPIKVNRAGAAGGEVKGLVEVYRSADDLISTLRHGMFMLWLVTTTAGMVLFFSLFYLFRSVYRRQREVETRFFQLSTEHERIVQMEKLSAMGRMVTEIAHQINNPLVGVINLTQLAEREIDKPQRVRDLLKEIRNAGEHCRNFVQRMLRFNQLARSEPQPTDMIGLLQDTIALFLQSAKGQTPVELDAPDRQVVLQVDPVLLRHALFNLINNAAQSTPDGPIKIGISKGQHEGIDGWTIAVTDHGAGLSPEVMKHLFTPFYTTRNNGVGLGLPVAKHIASQHGGQLYAKNNPEGGACFVIWLPAEASATMTL